MFVDHKALAFSDRYDIVVASSRDRPIPFAPPQGLVPNYLKQNVVTGDVGEEEEPCRMATTFWGVDAKDFHARDQIYKVLYSRKKVGPSEYRSDYEIGLVDYCPVHGVNIAVFHEGCKCPQYAALSTRARPALRLAGPVRQPDHRPPLDVHRHNAEIRRRAIARQSQKRRADAKEKHAAWVASRGVTATVHTAKPRGPSATSRRP